ATSIAYKEILNRIEDASPGAKHNFLFGFLDRARAGFERVEAVPLQECARCGQVTTGAVCAFCKLADQVKRAG
ncbi:MAG: tRNA(Ile)-lysidine synthetase, partial [Armatimonadota bacterium]|nr:tRNA(Ile)-lysidine synthetase [Armatimonadota bacterium]